MAKIYGLFGSMTGKLADTVMSVRNGEQIARKYQPVVYNPSTPAQVAQRAKLKLLSQLSAVMAPVIAIRKEGSVSARNLFTKVNFPATSYSDNAADITLTSVQLTKSVVSLPGLHTRREDTALNVNILQSEQTDLDRVVYCAFVKEADETLRYLGSHVVTEAGVNNKFPAVFNLDNASDVVVVYAYGVRDNNENARAVFGNLTVPTAESVAKIITSSTLLESDVTLTRTRALLSAPASQNSAAAPEGGDENRSSKKK